MVINARRRMYSKDSDATSSGFGVHSLQCTFCDRLVVTDLSRRMKCFAEFGVSKGTFFDGLDKTKPQKHPNFSLPEKWKYQKSNSFDSFSKNTTGGVKKFDFCQPQNWGGVSKNIFLWKVRSDLELSGTISSLKIVREMWFLGPKWCRLVTILSFFSDSEKSSKLWRAYTILDLIDSRKNDGWHPKFFEVWPQPPKTRLSESFSSVVSKVF